MSTKQASIKKLIYKFSINKKEFDGKTGNLKFIIE